MREAQELHEATEEYYAQPLEDNLFEWHFTVRGPPESEFEGGVYHGRVILPPDYPMKPPSIILLTPNGRFETNKKICLSISGHHPESWQPSWSLRTALLAIIGFMPTHGSGAIGSLDYSAQERKQLAKKSQTWSCPKCGPIAKLLREHSQEPQDMTADKEAREQAAQIMFKASKKHPTCSSLAGREKKKLSFLRRSHLKLDASERPTTPGSGETKPAEQSTPVPPPSSTDSRTPTEAPASEPASRSTPSAEVAAHPPDDTSDVVKRRLAAARILAQRAERLAQQQPPLAAASEESAANAGGRAASASSGCNMRLAYSAAIWIVGSAFVGLLIRRVFFL
ncbi:hypothetical protein HPB48_025478 [Haemaphysalis longicornis]|uniref:UBC core domain-containing protein n=1 Tax=Haemaphysalis longicornis TaxID=44386 RepID=A0A9J6H9X0_HAELO|nr:hypothetical protein HPB48_025478 [Haemaphysalis longicornis]